ncbi:MAG: hypothetical protein KatS3mg103_0517 [Phycisphaerales bacterium]|nr:MAG: hypothetical protein KatS3mg103_0517 [Phycisphaerales bacterium]
MAASALPGGYVAPTNRPAKVFGRRATPPSAVGEPMIWLTGAALVVCVVMIVGLVAMIVTEGLTTFWPRPIERVELRDGTVFLGVPTDTQDEPPQVLYRTGNRDIGTEPFRWVPREQIVSTSRPPEAVLLEREAWSVWLGIPQRGIIADEQGQRQVVAEGPQEVMAFIAEHHGEARERAHSIERLKKHDLGRINRLIEKNRLRVREAELAAQRQDRPGVSLGYPLTVVVLLASAGLFVLAWWMGRLGQDQAGERSLGGPSRPVRVGRAAVVLAGLSLALFAWLHAPWQGRVVTPERLEQVRQQAQAREAQLQQRYDAILQRIADLEAQDERYRVEVVDPMTGRFAPARQIEPDNPLRLSQIVRVVDTNAMGLADKASVFLSRWWEFLAHPPREANTEGGVFPVIVGTVMLTLLLTLTVTPLGVIAALYLREYAPQGLVTSTVRIAVNNLAGVPSIVYGVFGLGFFCYTLGQYIDVGSDPALRLPAPWWWALLGVLVVAVVSAYACGVWSRPRPGSEPTARHRVLRWAGGLLWLASFLVGVLLLVRTPYFTGFFEARGGRRIADVRCPGHAVGLADAGVADAAGGDRGDRGGHRRRAQLDARGQLRVRGQQVADGPADRPSRGHAWHPDRGDPGHGPRGRRGGPADASGGGEAQRGSSDQQRSALRAPGAQLHAPGIPHLRPGLPEPRLPGRPSAGVDHDAAAAGDRRDAEPCCDRDPGSPAGPAERFCGVSHVLR